MPRISVLLPCRNCAATVEAALLSLTRQSVDMEILAIDDASQDGSVDRMLSLGLRNLRILPLDRHEGITRALQIGLQEASGEFIARMDADDISHPDRFSCQLAAIEAVNAHLCFCYYRDKNENTGRVVEWKNPDGELLSWRGLFDNVFGPHSGAIFRKKEIIELGGYATQFARAQDYDLWDRCLAAGYQFAYAPKILLERTTGASSITASDSQAQADFAALVSQRALGRAFPGISKEKLIALRWLMTGKGEKPTDLATVLEWSIEAASSFLSVKAQTVRPSLLWHDVTLQISKRLKKLTPSEVALARRTMISAACKSLRPRTMALACIAATRLQFV
ncbi:hypothetical protein MTBLM1_40162 [Rhodospirillaceae bacterium LM-1]|nr:hypothetical protein MTBLM1_40162 [Rhodospirillaceae bacterium LM-1]